MEAVKGDFRVVNTGDQDATMVDVGVKGRPPGEPPDRQGTWASRVAGSSLGGFPNPEEILDDAFVRERVHTEFPDGEDGEPVITIGAEVLEVMNGLWKRCMIIKLLGRSVSVAVMNKKLREMWKPMGGLCVMDLPRHFFLVRFEREEEFLAALTGGPWRVFGSCLLTQTWSPEFDPLKDEISTTPVWIRLANLPVTFYHKLLLMVITESLGRPLKVDLTTTQCERGRFARVCVEVNLKKPLKGTLLVNRNRYFVSYEGLQMICSKCGLYGHWVHNCPQLVHEKAVSATPSSVPGEQSGRVQPEDGFTQVRRAGRRPTPAGNHGGYHGPRVGEVQERNLREIRINKDCENIPVTNKFGSLGMEDILPDSVESTDLMEENKENASQPNHTIKGKSVAQGVERNNGGNASKDRVGFKGFGQEKSIGDSKAHDENGPKVHGPKMKNKQFRPVRGLVFGQRIEDMVLLESGKRMRMESESVGRPAGFISNGRKEIGAVETLVPSRVDGGVQIRPESSSTEAPEQRDMVMRYSSPEGEVVSLVE